MSSIWSDSKTVRNMLKEYQNKIKKKKNQNKNWKKVSLLTVFPIVKTRSQRERGVGPSPPPLQEQLLTPIALLN